MIYKLGIDINFFFFGRNILKIMSKGEEENRNFSVFRYFLVGCLIFLVKMIFLVCFCLLYKEYLLYLFVYFVKKYVKKVVEDLFCLFFSFEK